MSSLLPLLFILACPLMMIFMMRGMGHGSHAGHTAGQASHGPAVVDSANQGSNAEDLQALRFELEERLQELDARIDELEQERAGSADVRRVGRGA